MFVEIYHLGRVQLVPYKHDEDMVSNSSLLAFPIRRPLSSRFLVGDLVLAEYERNRYWPAMAHIMAYWSLSSP